MSTIDSFDIAFGGIQPLAKIKPTIPSIEEVEDDVELLDRESINREASRGGLTDVPSDNFDIAFGDIKPIAADHRQPGVEPGAPPVFTTEEGIEYSPYDLPISASRKLQAKTSPKPKTLRAPSKRPPKILTPKKSVQTQIQEDLTGTDILMAPKQEKKAPVKPQAPKVDFVSFIKKHEGDKRIQKHLGFYKNNRFNMYKDQSGNTTVGYGHMLEDDASYIKSGKVKIEGKLVDLSNGITDQQADALLKADIAEHRKLAASVFGKKWDKLPEKAKLAATEMVFNLGIGGFKKYKKFQAALVRGDWETAAHEAHRRGIPDERNEAIKELLGVKA